MVVAAFVAPFLMPATVRFVSTAAQLPGVRLAVVTTAPAEQVPPELARHLAGHWRVDDALDPQQITDAVRGLSRQLGPVERLVGALEQLQVPLAQVRGALGIPASAMAVVPWAGNMRAQYLAALAAEASAEAIPARLRPEELSGADTEVGVDALLADPAAALPYYPMVSHRGGFPDGS